jgi:uncharacterized protein YeaO (DUF488 family)
MSTQQIRTKRVYEKAEGSDGFRILVDRLWPRGLNKENAEIDLWLPEIAPSNSLRKWFSHDPEKWEQFRDRYFKELDSKRESILNLRQYSKKGTLTFLYGARDTRFNNALALEEYLTGKARKKNYDSKVS